MVIAALLSFAILLIAWVFAPDRPRASSPRTVAPEAELQPLLEAA